MAHESCSHGTHSPTPRTVLKYALLSTALFMGVEFLGGWWSNSLALMTDGAHMLADCGALSLSLFASWLAARPPTPRMSFGYRRAEILGALLSGVLIWVLSGFLIFEAILRLKNPEPVQGITVAAISFVGLCVNLINMRFLHASQSKSLNLRAAYLHVLGDLLGSIGALISGVVIWVTGWTLMDPLITLLFAALVLWSAWALLRETLTILMEATPARFKPSQILEDLKAVPGVESVHDLHIWAVTNEHPALSVHLVSKTGPSALQMANAMLLEKHGIQHTTIQIEHPDHFKPEHCLDCTHQSV